MILPITTAKSHSFNEQLINLPASCEAACSIPFVTISKCSIHQLRPLTFCQQLNNLCIEHAASVICLIRDHKGILYGGMFVMRDLMRRVFHPKFRILFREAKIHYLLVRNSVLIKAKTTISYLKYTTYFPAF